MRLVMSVVLLSVGMTSLHAAPLLSASIIRGEMITTVSPISHLS